MGGSNRAQAEAGRAAASKHESARPWNSAHFSNFFGKIETFFALLSRVTRPFAHWAELTVSRIAAIITQTWPVNMNARKRILMIGWEYPPAITGGLGMACQGIAEALAGRGHEVLFLLPRLSGQERATPGVQFYDITSAAHLLTESERRELQAEAQDLAARDAEARVDFSGDFSPYDSAAYTPPELSVHTGSFGEVGAVSAQASAVRGAFGLAPLEGGYGSRLYSEIQRYGSFARKLASKLDFDVIHIHDWMTVPAGIAARRASGKPLFCHVHATEYDRSGDRVNTAVRDLELRGFLAADRVVAVSNYTRNALVERYGILKSRIDVVHNGVDARESSRESSRALPAGRSRAVRERLVLFLGRITYQKGPEYFLETARLVLQSASNVRFVMAGSGDLFPRMVERAAELGIGRFFHFTGGLNRKQVAEIYRRADLYVMPSVSEPFGIAPLEAAAHGAPILISRQSGVAEVLQGALRSDFWDVRDMASKILFALNNRALAGALRRRAGRDLRRITWDLSAEKLERLYEGQSAAAGQPSESGP
jgi:glycogen synthase